MKELTLSMLEDFASNNLTVKQIDSIIKKDSIPNSIYSNSISKELLNGLNYLKINSINQLEALLEENKQSVVKVAENNFSKSVKEKDLKLQDEIRANKGISIFYLGYVIAVNSNDKIILENYLELLGIHINEASKIIELNNV